MPDHPATANDFACVWAPAERASAGYDHLRLTLPTDTLDLVTAVRENVAQSARIQRIAQSVTATRPTWPRSVGHHHSDHARSSRNLEEPQIIVGVGLLVGGAATTALVAARRTREDIQRLDEAWYALVQRTRSAGRTTISKVLDIGFGTTIDWTARMVVTAVLVRQRRWTTLAGWASTIVLGELCIGPVKAGINRSRPPDPLTVTSDTSYPSGHSIAAATTAPGIVLALMPASRRRQQALGGSVLLAAMTALSRTDLNAHWLSDCIGGFSLGTGFALVVPPAVDAIADRV